MIFPITKVAGIKTGFFVHRQMARIYDSPKWHRLRKAIIQREPLCRMCKTLGRTTAATVVDHIEPLSKAPHRAFDESNLQPLCATCHDQHKMQIERYGYTTAVSTDGWPTDPAHPANRKRPGGVG